MVATYTCQRMTRRWPMVIFFNMLDVSAYNAYVLWTEINHKWCKQKNAKRRLFLEELGVDLVTPYMERRHCLPRTQASQKMVKEAQTCSLRSKGAPQTRSYKKVMEARECSLELIESGPSPVSTPSKRKRCQVCESKKSTKTTMTCSKCNIYICRSHAVITTYCYSCKKV